jgi:hypothetical protein
MTLLSGRASTNRIRFVQEGYGGDGNPMGVVDLELQPRDWDVTDPEAREVAGQEELGDDYDYHCEHRSAQWWVNPECNVAALAIYRPRSHGRTA